MAYRLEKRWPGTAPDEIDDAASAALVDLVDYWVTLESSTSNGPERNFAYAVRRGSLYATTLLVQRFREMSNIVSYDIVEEEDDDVSAYVWALEDESPGPEELVVGDEDLQRLRSAIENIPESEVGSWLTGWLNGLTIRQESELRDISSSRVHQLRHEGVAQLRKVVNS